MKYLTVCSGIEAPSVAWHPFGWRPAAFAEIEPFPKAVLAHHYPDVPDLGNFEAALHGGEYDRFAGSVDLVCGGTPCQSFSVAGLRKGMDDPRGNLALVFLGVVDRVRPRWVVWENVPGVLSADEGRAFGAFVGGLVQLWYGVAWRILDAQYVRVQPGFPRAVPQRRRRVFVIGYLGDWRPAAAVLLEPEGLRGDHPPSRKAGKGIADGAVPCLTGSGRGVERVGESRGQDPVVFEPGNLRRRCGSEPNSEVAPTMGSEKTGDAFPYVAHSLTKSGPIDVATAVNAAPTRRYDFESESFACAPVGPTMGSSGPPYSGTGNERVETEALVFQWQTSPSRAMNAGEVIALDCSKIPAVMTNRVRRLTPRECERLQGFPDDYTLIPYRGKLACDGPRYKALGNSMAVNVMRWIGGRIEMFENVTGRDDKKTDDLRLRVK